MIYIYCYITETHKLLNNINEIPSSLISIFSQK